MDEIISRQRQPLILTKKDSGDLISPGGRTTGDEIYYFLLRRRFL